MAYSMEQLRGAQGAYEEEQQLLEDKRMAKMAAAANIAQQIGVAPKGGAMGGAVSGAASGAAFGVPGAIVGGVAGAVMGSAAAKAAQKKREREAEAAKHRALGEIEMRKGQEVSNILGSMGARMGASLR